MNSAEIEEICKQVYTLFGNLINFHSNNTGITNFPPVHFEVYFKSIEIFEAKYPARKNELFILKAPIYFEQIGENWYSLHSRFNHKLDDFWAILKTISEFAEKLGFFASPPKS